MRTPRRLGLNPQFGGVAMFFGAGKAPFWILHGSTGREAVEEIVCTGIGVTSWRHRMAGMRRDHCRTVHEVLDFLRRLYSYMLSIHPHIWISCCSNHYSDAMVLANPGHSASNARLFMELLQTRVSIARSWYSRE
jgi:hypothetical protein